jgi:diguanylate cyclase (GGDEF)-like protein
MLDLDGFKALNDGLGHPAGDHALIVVADRLRGLVRPEDTVARLGGDEFAVLIEDFAGPTEVELLAARLVQRQAEPIEWEGRSVVIGASVGIAFVDVGLRGPTDLVRDADVALYAAKAAGRGQVRTFVPAMDAALASFTIEGELRTALDRGSAPRSTTRQPRALISRRRESLTQGLSERRCRSSRGGSCVR